jgi:hypothetical protein
MVPEWERAVVARALAKSPKGRWANCSEFTEALIGSGASDRGARGRRQWLMTAAVGCLCFAAGAIIWPLMPDARPRSGQSVGSPQAAAPAGQEQGKRSPARPEEVNFDAVSVFAFDGRSRIVTPVERFAPCTLEA